MSYPSSSNSTIVHTMSYPSSRSIGGDLHQQGVVMRADVGTLESRPVVDSDAHASWAAEDFDQTRVRLEILLKQGLSHEILLKGDRPF